MRSWNLPELSVEPHAPEIIASTRDARVIVLHLPAGERLQDHQVHETAWLIVIEGRIEIESQDGGVVSGEHGLLTRFDPGERHEVRALADTRLLLMLTPWPGAGHPGAMDLADKQEVRERAREKRRQERR